ncbi:hypothetical protein ILYODFUR_017969 [Ilyodon furcidens]|uniref:Uncharacterized protein n=1 Tax=Ilyodon furcidens TaxID=33524 RepID=A0ABV0SPK5_9TELE
MENGRGASSVSLQGDLKHREMKSGHFTAGWVQFFDQLHCPLPTSVLLVHTPNFPTYQPLLCFYVLNPDCSSIFRKTLWTFRLVLPMTKKYTRPITVSFLLDMSTLATLRLQNRTSQLWWFNIYSGSSSLSIFGVSSSRREQLWAFSCHYNNLRVPVRLCSGQLELTHYSVLSSQLQSLLHFY